MSSNRTVRAGLAAVALLAGGWGAPREAIAATPTAKQRMQFICNYRAAELGYEGAARRALVRKCLAQQAGNPKNRAR